MFAAIITISGFTAAIASSLTVSRLDSSIRGPEDLGDVKVATVKDSTSDGFLQRSRIGARATPDLEQALRLVAEGEAGALVYDAPILRYWVAKGYSDRVTMLPLTFERQDYAIGLPLDSKHRKPINQSLLRTLSAPDWKEILFRYLGE